MRVREVSLLRLRLCVDAVVDAATSGDDFRLEDVRRRRMSVYVRIPPNRLANARPLLNLLFSQLVSLNTQHLPEQDASLTVQQRSSISFKEIVKVAVTKYPKRAVLGFALFVGQAFLYNGVTFNLGTLLSTFYSVSSGMVPLFIIIWALGNFAGPLTLGRLFDTVGRKPMIASASSCPVRSSCQM